MCPTWSPETSRRSASTPEPRSKSGPHFGKHGPLRTLAAEQVTHGPGDKVGTGRRSQAFQPKPGVNSVARDDDGTFVEGGLTAGVGRTGRRPGRWGRDR